MKKRIILSLLCCALAFGALPVHAATSQLVDSSKMNLSAINSIEASRGIPVGTVIVWSSPGNPDDSNKWLECDGRSTAGYPELAAIVGGRTPDYRDQFLRGGGIGQVGQVAQDTTRSHYHGQPTHTHSVGTTLTSSAVSGSAAAQTFTDRHTGASEKSTPSSWETGGSHFLSWDTKVIGSTPGSLHFYGDTSLNKTNGPSAVTANLLNSSASGTAHASGADNTYENSNSDGTTGGTETAPQHIRVRYLIRAAL